MLHIGKEAPEARMPRESTDEVGIEYDGSVLRGEKSPEERRKEVGRARNKKRCGESYESVEDYDPVLQAHCRL